MIEEFPDVKKELVEWFGTTEKLPAPSLQTIITPPPVNNYFTQPVISQPTNSNIVITHQPPISSTMNTYEDPFKGLKDDVFSEKKKPSPKKIEPEDEEIEEKKNSGLRLMPLDQKWLNFAKKEGFGEELLAISDAVAEMLRVNDGRIPSNLGSIDVKFGDQILSYEMEKAHKSGKYKDISLIVKARGGFYNQAPWYYRFYFAREGNDLILWFIGHL